MVKKWPFAGLTPKSVHVQVPRIECPQIVALSTSDMEGAGGTSVVYDTRLVLILVLREPACYSQAGCLRSVNAGSSRACNTAALPRICPLSAFFVNLQYKARSGTCVCQRPLRPFRLGPVVSPPLLWLSVLSVVSYSITTGPHLANILYTSST